MKKRAFMYFFTFAIFFKFTCCYDTKKYSLIMPNVRPNIPQLYLCTPIKVDSARNYYIVSFEPNSTMATAHHMLIYGCTKPGSSRATWNCGEMTKTNNETDTEPPCAEESRVIYAWARDAPKLDLPEGVGFKVGGDSPIQYLVLQVHYAYVEDFKDGRTDDSGVFLHYTSQKMDKLAGVILLTTDGSLPAKKTTHMESACTMTENKTIHPFAYRTHTHSLGKVVSGYVVKPNNNWIELGKRDPLTPQMFYPVTHKVPITYGDKLASRCTMKNTGDRTVNAGSRFDDEMCNFYLMYYVEEGTPLEQKYCITPGPPSYYWKQELSNIPDKEASTL
ncbi:PREDICTED: peptidylglycine alpha-hydroxylating monooxygenase-like [Wasmannia auropunctata]|uniref:peptidylglycine alpha-hydroxylating monooxygenase-like n=1 Tax=Wasmannia auropunctata TaxID=64793 RepID=UPI0005F0268C|nr:PREDICTED: peptidylglycine alpha-hydroxylating monooxygenase-like [Wasmannia auropunctata]